MSKQEANSTDIYELKLIQKFNALGLCQSNKKIHSCSNCEEFIECPTRKDYVKAVYESMSKGNNGGFEF